MKSKCSFILKALTAMVLAVILLFSTVATGVAAIVEDIADTGAQVDVAGTGYDISGKVYFLNTGSWATPTLYIWKGDGYNATYNLTQVANTGIYYYSGGWSGYAGFKFHDGSWGSQSSGNITQSVPNNAFYVGSGTSYNSTAAQMNGTASVTTMISFNKGSTYSAVANSTIYTTISGGNLAAGGTALTTTGANATGNTTSNSTKTIYPAYGSTYTLTPTTGSKATFKGFSTTSKTNGVPTDAVTTNPKSKVSTQYSNSSTSADTWYAYYQANTYNITYNLNGGNFSTTPTAYHAYGQSYTLPTSTTTSKTGYRFDGWYEESDFSGSQVTTIAATDSNTKTYYAKWTELTHDVTVKTSTGGQISLDDSTYGTADLTANAGIDTSDNIYAQADAGYTFNTWTASAASITIADAASAATTINATADSQYVTASFTENTTSVTAYAGANGHVTYGATPTTINSGSNAAVTVGYHTPVTFTAVADTGYAFTGWTVGGTSPSYTLGDGETLASNPIHLTVQGGTGVTLTPTYVATNKTITVNTSKYKTSASDDEANYTALAGAGTVGITVGETSYNSGDSIPASSEVVLNAVPASGYEFVKFVLTDSTTHTEITNPYTIVSLDDDTTVTAYFRKGTYVKFEDDDGTELQAAAWVYYGADASAPADPSRTGYTFTGWSTNPVNITVTGDPLVLTAQYSIITYSVDYTALGMDDWTAGYAVSLTAPTPAEDNGSGTAGTADYGDTWTYTAADVAGYQFVGWVVANDAVAAAASLANNTVTTSGDDMEVTMNSTDGNDHYHIYALYKKIYYLTAYSSWVDKSSGGFSRIATPPKKVVITAPDSTKITYTYSYDKDAVSEDATVSATGTYNEGDKLQYFAGDKIELYYSALSSSEAIRGVFFNNGIRYSTEGQPDNMYDGGVAHVGDPLTRPDDSEYYESGDDDWEYTYEADTTLFANASYYAAGEKVLNTLGTYYDQDITVAIAACSSGYKATVDQDTHIVTIDRDKTNENFRNIDLEIANKHRIYFSDTDKIEITSENTDNYYDINETISSALKVAAKSNANCTYTITKSSIHFYKMDEYGNPDYEQEITAAAVIDKAGAATSTAPTQYITFSGTMPNYDIYVDLAVVTSYKVGVGSKCMADPVNGFTDLTTRRTVDGSSVSLGTITTSPSVANNTTGTDVNEGTSVTYTFAWTAGKSFDTKYMFLGWYESAVSATAPDFTKARLSTELSFSYTPKKNVRIWAVATRCFFIGGGFTQNAETKVISYSGSSWDSGRIAMEYDPSWVNTAGNVEGRYYFEFPNLPATGTDVYFRCYDNATGNSLVYWNQTCGGNNFGWYNENADLCVGHESGWNDNEQWDDHFGKNTNGAGYFHMSATNVSNGYGASVYVYFYPRSSNTGVSANSTYQWTNVYISGGYNGIESTTGSGGSKTYPTMTAGAGTTIDGPIGDGWDSTHNSCTKETVKHYRIKTKGGSINIAKTVDAGYKVTAFVYYDLGSKTAYAIKGSAITYTNSDRTATINFKPSGDCYITPIIEKTTADLKVYVRTSDLDKDTWGGLVSLYAWTGAEGSETARQNGLYPGQLMIPSDDGNSWYAMVDAGTMSGMLFANYFESGTWFTQSDITCGSNGKALNAAGGYNSGAKKIQTYDYREPIALYEIAQTQEGDNLIRFALKDGNTKTYDTTWATLTANISLGSYSWEYLTNYDGTKHIDFTGKELETESTATYYVIAQGDAYYLNSGFYPSTTADTKGGTKQYTYPVVADYNGKRSVQWYIYDATGAYLFTTLSAGFADQEDGMTHIVAELESRGLAYDDKSVKICYDLPRGDYSGPLTRYGGQWYTTDVTKNVTADVEIAVLSNDIYSQLGTAEVAGLGSALVSYTGTLDATKAKAVGASRSFTDTGDYAGTYVGHNGYTLPLYEAAKDKLTLYASSDNFIGWFTYDADSDEYNLVSKNPHHILNYSEDSTYYAVYSAKAIYQYQYTGRTGTVTYTVASADDMTPAEIADNQTPNSTNRAAEISALAPSGLSMSVFNKTQTLTFGTVTRTAPFTLTITGETVSDTSYTLTAHLNATETATRTGAYSSGVLRLNYDQYMKVDAYGKSLGTPYFMGWYDAEDGGNLISLQLSFGMMITKNLTVWPRFSATAREALTGYTPYIDLHQISKEFTGDGVGTYYNDNIVRFQGEPDTSPTASDCGILIIYQNDTASGIGELDDDYLTTVASNLRLDGNAGKTLNLKTKNAKAYNMTCGSLNNFNRLHLIFSGSYAKYHGKAYQVYAYWYDRTRDVYTFSLATSGTYN